MSAAEQQEAYEEMFGVAARQRDVSLAALREDYCSRLAAIEADFAAAIAEAARRV